MRIRPAPVISLSGRRTETRPDLGRPCPARTTAYLGFTEPSVIPCGLRAGHGGPHHYEITWADA